MPFPVRYTIVGSNPNAHLFEVTCTVDDPDPAGQSFRMPTWIPGSYLVREFARNVIRFSARAGDAPVAVEKTAKDTWRCASSTGPLTVAYEVYAWDVSVRAAHLDQSRAYFNGPSVFVEPVGRGELPCLVDIRPPAQASGHWRVATTLQRVDAPENGFGVYGAQSYDELIDHPVEMGRLAVRSFAAGGVVHDIAIAGRQAADLDRVAGDLARICEQHIALFDGPGGKPPFDRYLFQVLALGEGYGGLEHRSSTSLICSRNDLPRTSETTMSDGYRSLLGLASHEYFHAWNVKRIKPSAFVPYDLARESYTRQLWVFEGFTSYYDDLALVRSGVITVASYLELVGRAATSVLRGSGRTKQSVADSSFDAWIKFYRQDENAPNAIVSYYAKGALVALALDLRLRSETSITLDDVMRALWQRHGTTGVGVPEDGVPRLVDELTGRSHRTFFERYVYGTEDPPLGELLLRFGVRSGLRPAEGAGDKGGTPPTPRKALPVSLGVKLAAGSADAELATVHDGGAAQAAGLSAGDVLVALDGLRVRAASLDETLRHYAPGDRVRVHAFRRDELLALDVVLAAIPADTVWLEIDRDADDGARERRRDWLGRD